MAAHTEHEVECITSDILLNLSKNITLKSEQLQCIRKIANREDVLAVLPTGYGKSIIYCLLPTVLDKLQGRQPGWNICIIISPLISLMEDQVKKLESYGLSAIAVNSLSSINGDDMRKLQKGCYQAVLMSPEGALAARKKLFESDAYRSRVGVLVIDEAHCIAEWGNTFRPLYKEIGCLRSLLVDASVICLTATADDAIRAQIISSLCLEIEEPIILPANRPNIFYSAVKVGLDPGKYLKWIVQDLKDNQLNSKKYILYCPRISECSRLYTFFEENLCDKGYIGSTDSVRTRLFAMYHGCTRDRVKKYVQEEVSKINSKIRVVIATIAFGLGVDIPDVHAVLHCGVSKSLEGFYQESGRAGRNGDDAYSITYYTGVDVNERVCEKRIREFCLNAVCRRQFLFDAFTPKENLVFTSNLHECCDLCYKNCKCNHCPKLFFALC